MIFIRELNPSNRQDLDRCDGAFTVEARIDLSIEDGRLKYTIASVPLYEKAYPLGETDYIAYIDNQNRTVFLAHVDGIIAGQLRLARHWNLFANIEDLLVDRQLRRRGVGRALIEEAREWSREKELDGQTLETQTINLPAIRLYENCGFKLGGFDRYLYRGLHPESDKVALFWCFVSIRELFLL